MVQIPLNWNWQKWVINTGRIEWACWNEKNTNTNNETDESYVTRCGAERTWNIVSSEELRVTTTQNACLWRLTVQNLTHTNTATPTIILLQALLSTICKQTRHVTRNIPHGYNFHTHTHTQKPTKKSYWWLSIKSWYDIILNINSGGGVVHSMYTFACGSCDKKKQFQNTRFKNLLCVKRD